VAPRFRSLASVLRALASTSRAPAVAEAPRADAGPSLDTERVLQILRHRQRSELARRDRDTPARGLSLAPAAAPGDAGPPGAPAPPALGVRAPTGSGEGDAPVPGRRGT